MGLTKINLKIHSKYLKKGFRCLKFGAATTFRTKRRLNSHLRILNVPQKAATLLATLDGRTVKGTIQKSNRMLTFTLEGANCEKLYFKGAVKRSNLNFISGNYGVEEDELVDHF